MNEAEIIKLQPYILNNERQHKCVVEENST